jgi:hypothetical protein
VPACLVSCIVAWAVVRGLGCLSLVLVMSAAVCLFRCVGVSQGGGSQREV